MYLFFRWKFICDKELNKNFISPKDLPIERFYRDAPLMIIGEGTNEIMKLLIAKRVYENHF